MRSLLSPLRGRLKEVRCVDADIVVDAVDAVVAAVVFNAIGVFCVLASAVDVVVLLLLVVERPTNKRERCCA